MRLLRRFVTRTTVPNGNQGCAAVKPCESKLVPLAVIFPSCPVP